MQGTTNFNLTSDSLLLLIMLWGFARYGIADVSERRATSMLVSPLNLLTVFHDIEIGSVIGLVGKR